VDQIQAGLMIVSPNTASQCSGLVSTLLAVSPALLASLSSQRDVKSGHATSEDLAYIIFTSGSTGKPKGVMVQHKAVCSSGIGYGRRIKLTHTSRVLQFSSFVFDVSIAEILTTLIFGGCICVPSDERRLNSLAKTIQKQGVNWVFLTPSVARLISPADVPGLKTLMLGGEKVTQDNLDTWAGRLRLINGYGPTEACVFSVSYEWPMRLADNSHATPSTIGRATVCICWIVEPNDHNRLAPIGCIGELVIQGPTLALGYLNDAEKTASVFFEDPHWIPQQSSTYSRRFYKQEILSSIIQMARSSFSRVRIRRSS
jgi:non-ribosomal peptide synthetase component F